MDKLDRLIKNIRNHFLHVNNILNDITINKVDYKEFEGILTNANKENRNLSAKINKSDNESNNLKNEMTNFIKRMLKIYLKFFLETIICNQIKYIQYLFFTKYHLID